MPRRRKIRVPKPEEFRSPMPKLEDEFGPVFIPVWQPALALLAAISAVTFALLLYSKL